MGCVSSKLVKKNVKKQEVMFGIGSRELPNHVVSLTSSTYGALNNKLDLTHTHTHIHTQIDEVQECDFGSKGDEDALEVINTWELMEDLEEETAVAVPSSNQSNRKGKGIRSPFKRLVTSNYPFLSSLSPSPSPSPSPKEGNRTRNGKGTKLVGKENKSNNTSRSLQLGRSQPFFTTPRSKAQGLRVSSNSTNNRVRKAARERESPSPSPSPRRSDSTTTGTRRRNLGPLFDPELIESLEKELAIEIYNNNKEEIKEVVGQGQYYHNHNHKEEEEDREKRGGAVVALPLGGEKCVVMYTTTLRGIRKTFEECNAVRSAIEAYQVRVMERDISMDAGFKHELTKLLMINNQVQLQVPVVFVKGHLIGGAEEVLTLNEEGKLQGLLDGIPKSPSSLPCQACGGIRFVMCMHCNGSCKLLLFNSNSSTTMVRCGECNENGLTQCPLCC